MIMRLQLATIALLSLAALNAAAATDSSGNAAANAVSNTSAATPAPIYKRVYDRKYNTTYYVTVKPESEFVGTSARPSASAVTPKPAWARFGHP
jgi:hypothetical protein